MLWGARGRRFESSRSDHNKINNLAKYSVKKRPIFAIHATNYHSAVTRMNPPFSVSVFLDLWRGCGAEISSVSITHLLKPDHA